MYLIYMHTLTALISISDNFSLYQSLIIVAQMVCS